jgi:adenine phosphoribosyltransferase
MDLKKYIRSIQDYPKKGILFRDITTLIKNPEAFNFAIDKIIEISKKIEFDKVSAIESRGFIFASTVSYLTKKPLILLRKKNKLPGERHSIDFELEYGEATIEVHKDSIDKGEKILVIDDLIATGRHSRSSSKTH